ncbi:hypothetical protein [Sinorhizobium chiapasense]|uniref:Uncharacterized protein n=1 Tax=Sinorhizobium chiapasense TaxID=501572 RepID=A0ABZ2BDL3_9HYPH
MFRNFTAALAALVTLTFAAPAFAGPDRLLDALLSCKPEFFSVLKEERAALGPVSMEFFETASSRAIDSDTDGLFYQKVKFAKPFKVAGLSVIGYLQSRFIDEGKPASYQWALLIAVRPDALAGIFNARFGTAYEQMPMSVMWRNDVEAAPVSPQLMIEADFDNGVIQTELHCDHYVRVGGDMELPDAMELFGAPELGVFPLRDGDRLMKALLSCSPDFFDIVRGEGRAFGAVRLTREASSGKGDSPIVAVRADFPSIVHVWGMRLAAYVQGVEVKAGKPRLSWSLLTKEDPEELAHVIEYRTGRVNPDGKKWIDSVAWLHGLNKEKLDGDAPAQNFSVSRGKSSAGLLSCSIPANDSGVALPDTADLFLTSSR